MKEPAIQIEKVNFAYQNTSIIKDFSLNIAKGDFVCITGESGSGKSTLLKLLNGLLIPQQGKIIINGNVLTTDNVLALRRNMGYILQESALFPHLTVYQNMAYCLKLQNTPKKEIQEQIDKLLPLVNLNPVLLSKFPKELSGGQRQRVGIIRGIAHAPEIILMDEPFSALDPETRADLQNLVKEIHALTKTTFVMVTHSLPEAEKLSTRMITLQTVKN